MNRTGSKILHGMLLATSAMVGATVIVSTAAMANPAGGTVAAGSATITNPSATQTVINQSSKKALINWNSFSIPTGSSVKFNQPNSKSLTVNRVTGPGSSSIDGSLFANGNIWLLNANGILFGKGSQINVGSILATTSELSDSDFRAGNNNFTPSPNPNASVINQGTITASRGGSVVLSAPSVSNEGLIQADLGTVVLGGAQAFTVDMTGDNLLRYEIAAPVTQTPTNGQGKPALALVSNSGTISAAGGHVVMTARAAQNVEDNVINNTGMVEATSVSVHNGEVDIDAGPDGTANVGGTVDASGSGSGQTGGTVTVTGGTVNVADGAKIDVSGNAGGGTVLIGGGPHGSGTLAHAQRTVIGAATINADATGKGDGGNVTVWSDGTTQFGGAISSRGGAQGGNGGQVETSGHNLHVASTATVNTSAPLGLTGDWLLDPAMITIAAGTTGEGSSIGDTNSCITITNGTIESALSSTNVTLEATSSINVEENAVIDWGTDKTLSLLSQGDISIQASIQGSGTGGLNIIAGWDGTTGVTGSYNGSQAVNVTAITAGGAYGHGSGSISITPANFSVHVGSAGQTTLAGYDITMSSAAGPSDATPFTSIGYVGSGGGAVNVLASHNLSMTASGNGSVMIGTGPLYDPDAADVTGNISITAGNVTLTNSGNKRVLIGNNESTGSFTSTGDISLDVSGLLSVSPGVTIGNTGGASHSGNVSVVIGSLSESGNTLEDNLITDLANGNVFFGDNSTYSYSSDDTSFSTAHDLTIASKDDLTVNNSIQNSGSGNITLVSGWDGTSTTFSAGTPSAYGNNAGNLSIGGSDAFVSVVVGSSGGATSLFGDNVGVLANNEDAQVGYAGPGAGDIDIQARGNITVAAPGTYTAMIGGGGEGQSGTSTGNLTINASGNVLFDAYGSFSEIEIGNFNGNASGNISITAGGNITAEAGESSFGMQIGNIDTSGNAFGDITMVANGTDGIQFKLTSGNGELYLGNAEYGGGTTVGGNITITANDGGVSLLSNAGNSQVVTVGNFGEGATAVSGDVHITAKGSAGISLEADQIGNVAQIGNQGANSTASVTGNVTLSTPYGLSLTSGQSATVQIGNANNLGGGSDEPVGGDVSITAGGVADLVNSCGTIVIGNAANGTISGNLTFIAASVTEGDASLENNILADIVGGDVTVGLTDPDATLTFNTSANGLFGSAHNLLLMSAGDLAIGTDIQNGGSGNITLVAGWDGTSTTFSAGTPAAWNGGGNIMIGDAGSAVAVGSAGGATSLFGGNITIHAAEGVPAGFAQVGFLGSGTGAISITAAGALDVTAGNSGYSGEYAQIGHGSEDFVGDDSGDITIIAGSVTLQGGLFDDSVAQIGHGGQTRGNLTGNISVTATTGDVKLTTGGEGYALIGHNGGNATTTTSGNITVVSDLGNITLTAINDSDSFAQIGDAGTSTKTGKITVQSAANLTLTAGAGGSAAAQIGSSGGNITQNINVTVGGNLTLTGGTGSANGADGAQIGNGGVGNLFGGTGEDATGNINVNVTGTTAIVTSVSGEDAWIGNIPPSGSNGTGTTTITTGKLDTTGDGDGDTANMLDADLLNGDVSIKYTNQTSTDLGFLNYNSTHNLTIVGTGNLNLTDGINNCGSGSISVAAGGTQTDTAGNLTITGAVTTGGTAGVNNVFEAGDSVTIRNSISAGVGSLIVHAGEEKTSDGNAGAILDPLANLLSALSIRLVNDKGGTADQTVGTSTAPIYVSTSHLAIATAQDDVYVDSPNGGFDVGDGFFGIYGHNITLSANGSITQDTADSLGLAATGVLTVNVTGSGNDIALTDGGNGGGDLGNEVSGAIVLNSVNGNVSFVNTETTFVSGISAGGLIDVTVTDANQDVLGDGHSKLILAGTVTASGTGTSTLQATGDIVADPLVSPFALYNVTSNPASIDTTITANALSLISTDGSVGGVLPGDPLTTFLLPTSINALHVETASTGSLNLTNDKALVVGIAGDGVGLDFGSGGSFLRVTGGTTTQLSGDDGKIVGSNLTIGGGMGFTLNNSENAVSGTLRLYSVGNVYFTNSVDTDLAGLAKGSQSTTTVGGNFTITVLNGTLTQSGEGIYAKNLTVSASDSGGSPNSITLTDSSNDVTGTFTAVGSEIAFTNNGTLTVGEINGGVVPCVTAAGNVTLRALNGDMNITGGILAGDNTTIALTASGNITQTHGSGLDGDNLTVTSTSGNIALLNDNDLAGTINISAANGTAGLGNNDNTTLGNVTVSGDLTVLSEGNLTVTSSIQNTSSSNITLVAGWDGSTTDAGSLGNVGVYGGVGPTDGDIFIGSSASTGLVSVGSHSGVTTIEGHDINVNAANGSQIGYHGAGGGNITILGTGNLTIAGTAGQPAQVGNGDLTGSIAGNTTGDIYVNIGGAIDAQSATGVTWLGNIAKTGSTESGNVTVVADGGTFSGPDLFADLGTSAGTGGDLFIGLTDAGAWVGGLVYNSPHAFTWASTGSLGVTGDIENSGTGAINLIGGWDGTTTALASLGNSGVYGKAGDVTIGGAGSSGAVHVGGKGLVTVEGSNVTLDTSQGVSQLGYNGSGGGDIVVRANGTLTLSGGANAGSEAQIGNGTTFGQKASSGNITIDAGSVAVSGAATSLAGNVATISTNEGGIGSSAHPLVVALNAIAVPFVAVDGADVYISSPGGGIVIGNGVNGIQTNGGNLTLSAAGDITQTSSILTANANISTSSGNITLTGGGNYIGEISVSTTGNAALYDFTNLVLDNSTVGGNATFLTAGNLTADGSLQITGTGNITLVAGWDGATAPSGIAANASSYGRGNDSVLIGGENATNDVYIGSASGTTSVFGYNVTVQSSDAYAAQLGYHAGGSGAINVKAFHDVDITAQSCEGCTEPASIGNGNSGAAGSVGGNISIFAGHDVLVSAGGEGAWIGNQGAAAVSGTINVTANHSIQISGALRTCEGHPCGGFDGFIGNTGGSTGAVSGNIILSAGQDVLMDDERGNASVGNSGEGASVNGTINITAIHGNISLTNSNGGSTEIGNHGSAGITGGNIILSAGHDVLLTGEGGRVSVGNYGEGTSVTGTINISAAGNISLSDFSATVQIGNSGDNDNIAVGGDISVTANGTGGVDLTTGGEGSVQIGNLERGDGGQVGGNITVVANGGDIDLQGFSAFDGSTQIGNFASGNSDAAISGNIIVNATSHNVSLYTEAGGSSEQIGNGGNAGSGTLGGNITVSGGNLSLVATQGGAVVQIGNGGDASNGTVSGNINIAMTGGVTVNATTSANGSADYSQIGNGDPTHNAEGSVSGDITLIAGGALQFDSANGTAWLGNIGGKDAGNIESGNVTIIAASEADFDDASFNDLVVGDLGRSNVTGSGGNVFVGLLNSVGHTGPMIYNSPHTLSIASGGNLNITASIQNAGTGALNLIGGWNKTTLTPTSLANSGVYANNNGSVNIGGGSDVALVGSKQGVTTVAGANVTLNASEGAAQIGYADSASGNISVIATHNVVMTAGDCDECYVQIGGGTVGKSLTETGDVSVRALGNITLTAGEQSYAYAQIGNGGDSSSGTYGGNITVTAGGSLKVLGGIDYAQIGNAGWGTHGNASGNIVVTVHGNVSLTSGEGGTFGYAQIGNGGDAAHGNDTGNINVTSNGTVSLTSATNGIYAQIGNGMGAAGVGGSSGNIVVNAAALTLKGTSSSSGDDDFVEIGNNANGSTASGNITVAVTGTTLFDTVTGGNDVAIGNHFESNGSISGSVKITTGDLVITGDQAAQSIAYDLSGGAVTIGVTDASSILALGGIDYNSANMLTLLTAGTLKVNGDIENAGTGNITVVTGWNPSVAPSAVATTAGAYGRNGGSLLIGGSGAAGRSVLGSAGGTTTVLTDDLTVDALNGDAKLGYAGIGTGAITVSALGDVLVQSDTDALALIGNGLPAAGTIGGAVTVHAGGNVTLASVAGEGVAGIGNIGGTNSSQSGNIVVNATGTLEINSSNGGIARLGNWADGDTTGTSSGQISVNATSVVLNATGYAYSEIGNGDFHAGTNTGTVSGDITIDAKALTASANASGAGSQARIGNLGSGVANGNLTLNVAGNILLSGANGGLVNFGNVGGTSSPSTGNLVVQSGGTISLLVANGGDARIETGGAQTGNVTVNAAGNILLETSGSAAGGEGLALIGSISGDTGSENISVASANGNVSLLANSANSTAQIGGALAVFPTAATDNVTVSAVKGQVSLAGTGADASSLIGSDAGTGAVKVTAVSLATSADSEIIGSSADVVLTGAGNGIGSAATPLNVVVNDLAMQTNNGSAYIASPDQGLSIGVGASGINLGTGNLVLSADGGILQTDAIDATSVNVSTSNGSIALTNTGNTFATATVSSTGNAALRDSRSLTIAGANVTGNLTVAATSISQSGAIKAHGLVATASNGSIALTNTGNTIATAALNATGNAALTDVGSLSITGANVTGNLTVAAGSIGQTGAIDANAVTVTASNGSIALTNTGNTITSASLTSTGNAALTDSRALSITGANTGGNLTLAATSIGQSGAIKTHVLTATASNGSIALTNAGNTITTAALDATGNAALTDVGSFSISGADVGGTLTLNAGSIGQTGAIDANTVTVTASNGSIALTNTGNTITSASLTSTGNAALTDSRALSITGANTGGNLTLAATSIGQSGAIKTHVLTATASNGSIALTNTGNNVTAASLTATGNDALYDVASLTLDHASAGGNLTLATKGDLDFVSSVQLTSGAILAVAGWDGTTTSTSALTSGTAFGHSGDDITVGGASGVAIGSKTGTTTLAADDLVLSAINGYAQVGYHGGGSGAIVVHATGDVALNGGAATGAFAQIGDGGYKVSGSNSDAVSVLANGNVTLHAGSGQEAYAQIGNGGAESNSSSHGYTNTGAVTVHGKTVTLGAGSGSASYAQIGDGGYKSGQSLNGNATVGGTLQIDAVSSVTLKGNAADAYAQIGNGGDFVNSNSANGSGGTTSGNITVAVSNPVSAGNAITGTAGTGAHSYVQIGNGGNGENTPVTGATVHFTVGGQITIDDLSLTGSNSGTDGYAQIGNGDGAGTGTGNISGNISISQGTQFNLTSGTAPGTSTDIQNNTGTGTVTGSVSGYTGHTSTPASNPSTAGSVSTIIQNNTTPTSYTYTASVAPQVTEQTSDLNNTTTGPSSAPTPLEKLAGDAEDEDVPSDSAANSVGDSLNGGKVHVATKTLIPGVLDEIITLTPQHPHGVPPADEDYSSWGNEALWRW